jgi:hypothetical protein
MTDAASAQDLVSAEPQVLSPAFSHPVTGMGTNARAARAPLACLCRSLRRSLRWCPVVEVKGRHACAPASPALGKLLGLERAWFGQRCGPVARRQHRAPAALLRRRHRVLHRPLFMGRCSSVAGDTAYTADPCVSRFSCSVCLCWRLAAARHHVRRQPAPGPCRVIVMARPPTRRQAWHKRLTPRPALSPCVWVAPTNPMR